MRESIVKSGAVITGSEGNYRVNGELRVARALGRSGPRQAISAKETGGHILNLSLIIDASRKAIDFQIFEHLPEAAIQMDLLGY